MHYFTTLCVTIASPYKTILYKPYHCFTLQNCATPSQLCTLPLLHCTLQYFAFASLYFTFPAVLYYALPLHNLLYFTSHYRSYAILCPCLSMHYTCFTAPYRSYTILYFATALHRCIQLHSALALLDNAILSYTSAVPNQTFNAIPMLYPTQLYFTTALLDFTLPHLCQT